MRDAGAERRARRPHRSRHRPVRHRRARRRRRFWRARHLKADPPHRRGAAATCARQQGCRGALYRARRRSRRQCAGGADVQGKAHPYRAIGNCGKGNGAADAPISAAPISTKFAGAFETTVASVVRSVSSSSTELEAAAEALGAMARATRDLSGQSAARRRHKPPIMCARFRSPPNN